MTSATPPENDLARQERRLALARQIADRHYLWSSLAYMDDCPLGTEERDGNPHAMQRIMVVTSTDGDDDGWLDFEDDRSAVEGRVRGLVEDEWGLVGVWDLDREDLEPVKVTVTVSIDMQQETAPDG